jgi:hypothetical protein
VPTEKELSTYKKTTEKLEDWQKDMFEFGNLAYVISVKNTGGMIMPLVFDIDFKKGESRRLEVPVEVWRFGDEIVKVPFISEREVVKITLDRDNAFADSNLDNNVFPQEIEQGRFKLKPKKPQTNPMQKALFPDADKNEEDKKE